MNTIKIGIASRNMNVSNKIKSFLSVQSSYEVVWIANNENDAFKFYRENAVEFLVWDIIEPLSFKESCLFYIINTATEKPVIIIASDICLKDNTRYYDGTANIVIPFDFTAIDSTVEMFKEFGAGEGIQNNFEDITISPELMEMNITSVIHNIGVPPHLKGYHYLRYGISLVVDNMGIIGSVTKELYPKIAEKYNTTSSRVERDIRHAISLAWGRNVDNETVKNMFFINAKKRKPTNSEFIAKIADQLRLEKMNNMRM